MLSSGNEDGNGCSNWSDTEMKLRMGDWIWRTGGRGENLQLGHLLHWQQWPESSPGPGMHAGLARGGGGGAVIISILCVLTNNFR